MDETSTHKTRFTEESLLQATHTNTNIKNKGKYSRSLSHVNDELSSFRCYLRWMCVDQSNAFTATLSWFVFFVFALAVPAASHFFIACPDCDARHSRPYDAVVQLSLSSVASLSFLCLSSFVRKYGLRRFLFLDKLCDESETVRMNYMAQLNRSLKLISVFAGPCFIAMSAYKIWWYTSGGSQIPFLGNVYVSDIVACILELCSWLYRTTVIFLVCVLFRLICHLQILRLQDFATYFRVDSDVQSFVCLLETTKAKYGLSIYKTGELMLCSVTLLSALSIMFRSATKITHKAQAITGLAAKWHVCATLDSFDGADEGGRLSAQISHEIIYPRVGTDGESEGDDAGDEEDEIDNTKLIASYSYSTISYQKRQALVNYFENNKAGITVYGFMLDRSTLHTIFGIQLSLVLWLLGKTIGIS
ncbi:unnamed protein product [Vicia faba]|uniref:Uncharacterized protein n=1 Tax=Vicia faba TaxID=3906 RepID=A0AAV0ZGI0_VICFA|nr:unnamed protein product [Vicia faba]